MKAVLILTAALGLGAYSGTGGPAGRFAADRPAAEAAVAACDTERRTRNCDAARKGLSEAKRRDRQALYRQTR